MQIRKLFSLAVVLAVLMLASIVVVAQGSQGQSGQVQVTAQPTVAEPAQPGVGTTAATTGTVTGTAGISPLASGTPSTLPVTGGSPAPWSLVLLAVGGLLLLGGAGLALARRS